VSDTALDRPLSGKHALVTGGARGIGLGIARAMADAGAHVTIADRDGEVAADAARALPAGAVVTVAMDVADRASVERGIERAQAAFGLIDVVVANAGILKFAPFLELSTADWQQHLDVDFTGVFHTAQATAQRMAAAGRPGSIIVITSVSAEVPSRTQGHYCAAKAGALMLVRAMAWELADRGIRVNSIGPGWIETRLGADYLDVPELRAGVIATIPIGRLGQPRDVGAAAVFLAGDNASYVTGAHLRVDGGLAIGSDKT
jgi:NAD(P)-dependent dehydrogenase (short-subunit alcohol dehydrogenase family)